MTDKSYLPWGNNYHGQLGDGTTIDRQSPVHIMDNVTTVVAGTAHTMAIQTDGSLWAWGDNTNGQLGDGTQTTGEWGEWCEETWASTFIITANNDRHSPVQILSNVMLPANVYFDGVIPSPYDLEAVQITYSPSSGALAGVTNAAAAQTAIAQTISGLTLEQRQSGDALNTATLHIENLSRRGTTQPLPGDGGINISALAAGASVAGEIWQGATAALVGENLSLLRETRTNVNFVSGEPDMRVYFPDDVSGIAFDNASNRTLPQ